MATISKCWLACAGGVVALFALAVASVNDADLIVFNHSSSIPEGFYVRVSGKAERGAIVTVRAIDVAPTEARRRHYDQHNDRFLKRVRGVGGQSVCSDGQTLSINGRVVATVYAVGDRSTPRGWVGCRTLGADEVLLLGDSADSFDGRYWGPVSTHLIEGVWRPF